MGDRPPPVDLKDWSKRMLVREVERLRAVLREHSRSLPTAHSGGGSVDAADDPYAIGGVVIDSRGAVLLDSVDVLLVDTKGGQPVAMMLTLSGRINYANDRADTAYLLGSDGAAALVSEIAGLSMRAPAAGEHGVRFAEEFRAALQERISELPQRPGEPDES